MEDTKNIIGMLELMVHPAFCVKKGKILHSNQAAQSYMLSSGTPVRDLLATGVEEYEDFSEGDLYLTMQLAGRSCGAAVTRFEDVDVFVLDQEPEQTELQAMALAAQELRGPLSGLIAVADKLFPNIDEQNHSQVAQMNRSMFQIQRIVGNMSDASRFSRENASPMDVRNITAIFREVFARARELISSLGITLRYTTQCGSIYCMTDEDRLERAIYNILSNAVKFTPKGGTIDVRLIQRGNKLYLTVQDSGSGIDEIGSVHSRYRREPRLEDGRLGIGLGMVLIRTAAAVHGGTLLIEQPKDSGARVTMTIAIRESGNMVRSPLYRIDYAGHRDHGLLELSESLPWELYDADSVN